MRHFFLLHIDAFSFASVFRLRHPKRFYKAITSLMLEPFQLLDLNANYCAQDSDFPSEYFEWLREQTGHKLFFAFIYSCLKKNSNLRSTLVWTDRLYDCECIDDAIAVSYSSATRTLAKTRNIIRSLHSLSTVGWFCFGCTSITTNAFWDTGQFSSCWSAEAPSASFACWDPSKTAETTIACWDSEAPSRTAGGNL